MESVNCSFVAHEVKFALAISAERDYTLGSDRELTNFLHFSLFVFQAPNAL